MIIIISLYESNNIKCKPLIIVNGKKLIELTLENLKFSANDKFIFLMSNNYKINYSLDDIIKKILPDNKIDIITIEEETNGLPETIVKSYDFINNNENLIIYSPYIYLEEKIELNKFKGNFLFYFKSNCPNHSYVEFDDSGEVINVKEKIVISKNALVGIYGFENKNILIKYNNELLNNNLTYKKQYYISLIYNLMIRDKIKINTYFIEKMYPLGDKIQREIITKLYFNSFSKNSKIGLASDHSGYKGKLCMMKVLDKYNIKYVDYGCYNDKDCDYNDFINPLAKEINLKNFDYGFGFCRTGQGVNICANKKENIISALIIDNFTCQMAIEHNGANFFCFPEKNHSEEKYKEYLDILLKHKFLGGRFLNRYIKNKN